MLCNFWFMPAICIAERIGGVALPPWGVCSLCLWSPHSPPVLPLRQRLLAPGQGRVALLLAVPLAQVGQVPPLASEAPLLPVALALPLGPA